MYYGSNVISIKPDNFIANACLAEFCRARKLSGLFPEVLLITVCLCDKVPLVGKSPVLKKTLGTDPLDFQIYSHVNFSIKKYGQKLL